MATPKRVPIVRCGSLSSHEFFRRFVARRRPVVLMGMLPELERLPDGWWASARARELDVQVEKRDGPADAFGHGRRVRMCFGHLLDSLEAGDTSHYLTTQESSDDRLLTAPLTAAEGLPLRPRLLRTLFPQSINLWLGRAAAPTSSGVRSARANASSLAGSLAAACISPNKVAHTLWCWLAGRSPD